MSHKGYLNTFGVPPLGPELISSQLATEKKPPPGTSITPPPVAERRSLRVLKKLVLLQLGLLFLFPRADASLMILPSKTKKIKSPPKPILKADPS